uniref:Uncharacterized protein n=1 Tax=Dictyoglomus thermophilum TaxID=14 RepID=A0A7C3MJ30_DICTH
MGYLGRKYEEIEREIGKENIIFDLNYLDAPCEAFGDLRIVAEKRVNGKWYFLLSYENYQIRNIKDGRDSKR